MVKAIVILSALLNCGYDNGHQSVVKVIINLWIVTKNGGRHMNIFWGT